MAHGNGKTKIQEFVRGQMDEARGRFESFEKEAQHALKGLIAKGKEHSKELETLLERLNTGDLQPAVKQWGKRANQATVEVRKKLDHIQDKVVRSIGVASQSQVGQINRELARLSKKLDALVGRKASRSEGKS